MAQPSGNRPTCSVNSSERCSIITCWNRVLKDRGHSIALTAEGGVTKLSFFDLAEKAEKIRTGIPEQLYGKVVALAYRDSVEWLAAFIALRAHSCCILPLENSIPKAALTALFTTTGTAAVLSGDGLFTTEGTRSPVASGSSLLKLTSGTTGSAKIIPFTDSALISDADNVCRTMGISGDDISLALLPLGHSYALGNLVLPLLTRGVALSIGSSHLPSAIEGDLDWSNATVLASVPQVWHTLCRSTVTGLNRLRLAISAAAPLSPALARAFNDRFDQPLHNFYGASETGGIAYDRSGEAGLTGCGVGTALDGVMLQITDSGCLNVTSRAISHALGSSVGSARTLTLPDRASIEANGIVQLLGRTDRTVKVSGHRIDLEAIESTLCTELNCDGVTCVLMAGGDRIAVFVAPGLATLGARVLGERMPSLRRRFTIHEIEKIPRTPRGKVDTTELLRIAAIS